MPELPEVETLRRQLDKALRGRTIRSITVHTPKSVHVAAATFKRSLAGKKLVNVTRRAKLLFLNFQGGQTVAIHLKMTGQLIIDSAKRRLVGGHPDEGFFKALPNPWTRLMIDFGRDKLYFNDSRRFGFVKLFNKNLFAKWLKGQKHGPEPLDPTFTVNSLRSIVERRGGKNLKAMLLDQTAIAGIGNIYADESLWRAKLKPTRRVRSLTVDEMERLHTAIVSVLKTAVRLGGTSMRDYRQSDGTSGNYWQRRAVYGRTGKPCRRCGTPIKKTMLAGRGTHYCPKCQR